MEKNYSRILKALAETGSQENIDGYEEARENLFVLLKEETGGKDLTVWELRDQERYEAMRPAGISGKNESEKQDQAEKRRIVYVRDMEEEHQNFLKGESILNSSMLAFPVFYKGRLIGMIKIDRPNPEKAEKIREILPVIGGYLGSIRSNTIALERERQYLDVLCRDYTSVYIADLKERSAAMLKLESKANSSSFIPKESRVKLDYVQMMEHYAREYIVREDAQRFMERLNPENLSQELQKKERIVFRYRSTPNLSGHQYFEVQIVRINQEFFDHQILVGFHHIDDVVAEEQKQQLVLERMLRQTEASNEVLSALGKIYYAIYRINLPENTMEEISSNQELHRLVRRKKTASEAIQEICNTYVVPEYRKEMRKFFDLTRLAKRLQTDDTQAQEYLGTDGNWHTARFIVNRRNARKEPEQLLYVTRLVSDAKRREKNWITIAQEANKANRAKTEFISQIAHDIRTPMNAIMGFTAITQEHVEEPERVRYGLEKIRMAGGYLQELVNEVLDISKIENGQMKIERIPLDLEKFLREIRSMLEQIRVGKDLEMHMKSQDILQKYVLADPLALKQIYMNIVSNAVKYTPESGKVEVEIREQAAEDPEKIYLITRVSDNGIGMSKEYMDQMYSKFTRETDTRVNKVRGYGLGLSIVKELVDSLRGKIEVESELGKGTVFTVTLPLKCVKEEDVSAYHEEGVSREPDGIWKKTDTGKTFFGEKQELPLKEAGELCKGMCLLVAEDNDLNYEVIQELLQMQEIHCERAVDGFECAERFKESPLYAYDAILMDVQMPGMNGIQATEVIRNMNRSDAHIIPIIAMTANAMKEDRKACMDAGMNAHLAKPVDMKKLLNTLAELRKNRGGVVVTL